MTKQRPTLDVTNIKIDFISRRGEPNANRKVGLSMTIQKTSIMFAYAAESLLADLKQSYFH